MNRIIIIIIFNILLFNSYGQDFEVSPLKLLFNSEPGESQTKFVNIKNHNNKPETFILNISDFSIDSKGQGTYVEAGSMKYSVADWISISPTFFELEPNEEKQIAVTMQQSSNEYGSKWGVIFVRTAKEQTSYSADKQVSAGMSLSARIAIEVIQTPKLNRSFKVTIDNLMEITTDEDSTKTFVVLINNLEDIITDCNIFLIATDIQTGEETYFPEQKITMYPKSSRKVELYMPNILPKGTYSLASILDYGSRENLEGTQMILKIE